MKHFNDFDLDVIASSKTTGAPKPRITSKSLCTPGCPTGVLQGCSLKTATCGCSFTGK